MEDFAGLRRVLWRMYGRLIWDDVSAPWSESLVETVVGHIADHRLGPDERVLDACCGEGDYSLALAEAGFRVLGGDQAAAVLVRARQKGTHIAPPYLAFERIDLNRPLPFADGVFDHVVGVNALQKVGSPLFLLRELHRVLRWPGRRPGGTLLIAQSLKPQVSLIEELKYQLGTTEPWRRRLQTILKAMGRRVGGAARWSGQTVAPILRKAGFAIEQMDEGPPLVIVAERQ